MELLIIIRLVYAYRIDPDREWRAATSEERERCIEVVVDQQSLTIADDGKLGSLRRGVAPGVRQRIIFE